MSTISAIRSLLTVLGMTMLALGIARAEEPKTVMLKVKDIALQIPATWKEEKPANRLRLAQLAIPAIKDDEEPSELVISFFGGDGGGIDPNLKRWVGQFSSEGRSANFTKGECPTGTYYVSDVKGTFLKSEGGPFAGGKTTPKPGYRAISVILVLEDKGNYFLKLTGPEKTVSEAAAGLRKSFGGKSDKESEYEPQ